MKNFTLTIGAVAVLAMLGAGCAKEPSGQPPQSGTPSANTNAAASAPVGELKDLPAFKALSNPFDDSSWVTTTTKTGVSLKAPIKGSFAPTWTYALLKNDDPNLKGDCYVTEGVVYKRTDFSSFTGGACQTTSELNPGPGERTDYFVFHNSYTNTKGAQVTQTHLFTFTKKYPAGFDMDAYSATLNRIINIID